MRMLLNARSLGRAEKLAWEFPFTFRGRPCSIASEKFGLRLYLGENPGEGQDTEPDIAEAGRTVVSKLSAAVRCLERHVLSVLATEQVAAGNLTIHNQAGRLRSTYEYFRRLATDAYAGRGILARDYDDRSDRTPFLDRFRVVAEQAEGLDAAMAMTVAYFSLLEHLLVLVLPATDFDPSAEPVTGFIRLSCWRSGTGCSVSRATRPPGSCGSDCTGVRNSGATPMVTGASTRETGRCHSISPVSGCCRSCYRTYGPTLLPVCSRPRGQLRPAVRAVRRDR
jgi:hypothetical protein